MRHETQDSITEWAAFIFGPAGTLERIAARANEEMAELLRAVTAGKPAREIADEAADALIVLARLGYRMRLELLVRGASGMTYPADVSLLTAAAIANTNMERAFRALALGLNAAPWIRSTWAHLKALIELTGMDAQTAVDAKMAVNRTREWKSDGTGHGYHTRARDPQDATL